MAVSWTAFADLANLGTLRSAINTFNASVENNIATIEADTNDLTINKINIVDTGIVFAIGSGAITGQSLTTAYTKVEMVDTTSIAHTHDHITMDYIADTFTVNTNGVYKIRFSGSMTANNLSLVSFNYNINGVSFMTTPPEFVGRGTGAVAIENSVILELIAGTTIYIEAKADGAVTMTPIGCGLSIEKTHY